MTETELVLRDCALSDLGKLDYEFAQGDLPRSNHPLLVVRLFGVADNREGGVYSLASAIVMGGLEAWQPSAVILDLRGLDYSWGDRMQNVLGVPQRWYEPVYPMRAIFGGDQVPKLFPLAVVVSDLNREGLVSLVRDELQEQPDELLFESIEDAARALDDKLAGVPQL
jgi:hypothetical protein